MCLFLEIEDVASVCHLLQLIYELCGVLVHDLVKVLQDVEVEGWSYHLPVFVPFAAGTGEEPQSQPWVSKIIYIGLGYQSLTAKYKLRKSCIVTILALALLTCHTHLHVFGISDHNIGVVTYPITKVILAVLMPPAKKPVQNLWRAKLKHIITCSTIR